MPFDPYQDAISRLTVLGPLRVWSLLVTVFGDLTPDERLQERNLEEQRRKAEYTSVRREVEENAHRGRQVNKMA